METEENTQNELVNTLSKPISHFRKEATEANHRYLYHRDRNSVAAQRSDTWSKAMASAADQVEGILKTKTEMVLSEPFTAFAPDA